ncbi:MAG: pilus assembly protein PilM [Candidatus Omnitrophica bacterium]|nr:pilus assembly protein PilM [Candidatus Omnitrophota bacterium]
MREIGLYLGNQTLSAAATENKKVISFSNYSLSESDAKPQDNELNFEVSLNKVSRELQLQQNETINLAIADKEFIIRSFVIPSMSRKEIESSMEFEIDKYIPFKMEDLEWNYSYERISRENKILVSFIGYKRKNFTQYTDSFNRLGFTPKVIEPGGLALMRMVKSMSQYVNLKWYAILEVAPKQGNITFFYNTLPVFSRVVSVDHEGKIDAAKVLEETRFSFQYFKREFRAYDLEKLLVITQEAPESLASMGESLELPVEFINPGELVGADQVDVSRLKAYSSATFDHFIRRFSPCIKLESPFLGGVPAKVSPFRTAIAIAIVVVGVVITIFINASYHRKIVAQEKMLEQKQKEVQLSDDLKRQNIRSIRRYIEEKEKQINVLATRTKARIEAAPILKQIEQAVLDGAQGVWLSKVNFNGGRGKNDANIRITGYIYLNDPNEETLSLDRLMLNLNRDSKIKESFSRLELGGKDKESYEGFEVTMFQIKLY